MKHSIFFSPFIVAVLLMIPCQSWASETPTWSVLQSGTYSNLNNIDCPDNLTCYVSVGAPFSDGPGAVLKTTNGGEQWSAQNIPTSNPLRGISCPSANTCYAVGDAGAIIKTTDGGTTWTSQSLVNEPYFWDVWATDENTAFAVGNAGILYKISRGETRWTRVNLNTDQNLLGIYFQNQSTGYIVGESIVLGTTNGGLDWSPISAFPGSTTYYDAVSLDGQTLWVSASVGRLYKSQNGLSMSVKQVEPTVGLRSVDFLNASIGFAAGNGGVIVKTIDGGDTWAWLQNQGNGQILRDIKCFPTVCYAVGDSGTILRYNNVSTPSNVETPASGTTTPAQESTPPTPESTPPAPGTTSSTTTTTTTNPPSTQRLRKVFGTISKTKQAAIENKVSPPAVKKKRGVSINPSVFRNNNVLLNLFPDKTLTAEVTSRVSKGGGKTFIKGKISGEETSSFTLITKGNKVAGSINTPEGIYSIIPGSGNSHTVEFINQAELPEDIVSVPPQTQATTSARAPLNHPMGTVAIVDVFVVFTRDVLNRFDNDRDALNTYINFTIEQANDVYRNSEVGIRLRLVGTRSSTYFESGNPSDDLDYITSGAMAGVEIRNPRDDMNADIAMMIVVDGGDACGIAWQQNQDMPNKDDYAFGVVDLDCIPNYTFVHEVGHIFGAGHEEANQLSTPMHEYSYGYQDPSHRYRTVMSYMCPNTLIDEGCFRIPYFSTANITFLGNLLGDADHDNARTLNETRWTVRDYRR